MVINIFNTFYLSYSKLILPLYLRSTFAITDFFKMDPVSSESPIDMSEKHIEELRLQATKVYLAACEALKDHSGSTGYQEKRQKFIDAEQEAFEATFNAGDRYGKLDRRLKSLKKEEAPDEEKIQKCQKELDQILESKPKLLQAQKQAQAQMNAFIADERELQEQKNDAHRRMQELFSKSGTSVSRPTVKRLRPTGKVPPHPIQSLLDLFRQTHLTQLYRKYEALGLQVTAGTMSDFAKSWFDQELTDDQKKDFTQEDLVQLLNKMKLPTEKAEGKEVTWQFLLEAFSRENPPKRRKQNDGGIGEGSAKQATEKDADGVEEDEPAGDRL